MAGDAPASDTLTPPLCVIVPPRGYARIDWRELWTYRELLGFMVWRDISVKYKQALLGVAWAVLVPFCQMIVFSFIFGAVAGLPTEGLPKPVFYYAALLPWTYFATAVSMSANSLVGSANLLTKIYFPRLIVPAAPCLAGLFDFAIAFLILVALMVWYQLWPPLAVVLLPLLIGMALVTSLGVGMALAALNVKYRDFRYVVPFLTQMWMYCTVIIPFSAIPERYGPWRYLYGLNPMAGVVEGFRWCLLHPSMTDQPAAWGGLPAAFWLGLLGLPVMAVLFWGGLVYFRRMERQFADIV